MRDAFSARILKRHEVSYRQCPECRLLQTEEPYWLDEAYSEAIVAADTGLVMRNYFLATKLAVLLYRRFEPNGGYLDIAGGYGMLARLMRDYGFDYYWDDKFCPNLLARGFEVDKSIQPFVALTAFEVIEHIHDPLAFIQENMGLHGSRTLIFTTELCDCGEPPPKEWWYYAFSTGQHISFYQRKTLEALAERLGLNFYSLNGLHILTDRVLRTGLILRLIMGRLAPLMACVIRRRLGSRTLSDHFMLMDP
ncbi:class I SAM-dependent methyltransferase [Desulfopila sp. IMCC35006]|uniref:class I SAM-dependent methyltransferase n=1 Tax=Desulfopila sp. IMCC35006 TaxID=2569542 RepID=UPI0010ABC2BB|nr:class I SAM-dependent methyltransferase [Desulfopila sp. IMCC35006]TKB26456.1 class I SAM-dependent methyltransferase [Desulfopila sp. IMCC35006]